MGLCFIVGECVEPLSPALRYIDLRQGVTTRLRASCLCNALPVQLTLKRSFGIQAQHPVGRHQWGDARNAQFGGFFHQPIHALIGGHPYHYVAVDSAFALYQLVAVYACSNGVTSHLQDAGRVLTTAAIKQSDGRARLQAQNLDVAAGVCR